MSRCTVSHHQIQSGEHLDIFFETSDFLETYEAPLKKFEELMQQKKILCSKKKPHRKIYLDYQGEISNRRGWIKILWKGFYLVERNLFPNEMSIRLINKETLLLEF